MALARSGANHTKQRVPSGEDAMSTIIQGEMTPTIATPNLANRICHALWIHPDRWQKRTDSRPHIRHVDTIVDNGCAPFVLLAAAIALFICCVGIWVIVRVVML